MKPTVFGFPVSGEGIKDSIKTSPQLQSKRPFSSDSESQVPTVGIFGPAFSIHAPYNKDTCEFEPTFEIATFLSGDAHISAKETFDLKFKEVHNELASHKPGSKKDILRGECESLILLEDLIKIEDILQDFTAGYTDTDLDVMLSCSWMEGIYIASIQAKLALIGRSWKANFDPLDAEHIEAVDGVPRSPGELKVLSNSITG